MADLENYNTTDLGYLAGRTYKRVVSSSLSSHGLISQKTDCSYASKANLCSTTSVQVFLEELRSVIGFQHGVWHTLLL